MNILNNFSFDRFLGSLRYVFEGMACIFIVIGIIILFIYGMNRFMNKKAKDEKDSNK